MENFTTRVELYNADDGDHALLQEEMRRALFCRAVKHRGFRHDLPDGEYDCSSDFNTIFIFNLAYTAVQAVIDSKPINDKLKLKDFWIVVTKSDGERIFKLAITTDIGRLPLGEPL